MYMICYQLPNGKSIYLSVDQILRLEDSDIQYMIEMNMGYETSNPFRKMNSPKDHLDEDEDDEVKDAPDMLTDGDDDPYIDIDIENIPDSD